ncbi:MAG: hypothetical protein ABF391_16310 [Akkermansiaceae bacterium]
MNQLIPYAVATILLALSPCVSAFSSDSVVAVEGRPIPEEMARGYGWPEGVLALLNSPFRTGGWNPWFSELRNDVNIYAMKPRDSAELAQLIKGFAAIRSEGLQIRLEQGPEPVAIGFTTKLPKGNGIAAKFSIGCQKATNQWYRNLPEVEPGVREFGGQRFVGCPKASPPILTLYVGNDAVDLTKLEIPESISVSLVHTEASLKEHKGDPDVNAINVFVEAHKRKRAVVETAGEKAE